uniref:RING-type domain-containing protein n=1 Tax=Panagrolaimus sp. PS1159 TaxID=55785 RepID=A0AC35G1R1_9BILA
MRILAPANLIEIFSNDPIAFKDTDPKYICGICNEKFSTVKVGPCQDISFCRQCLVNHFQKAGSITLAGLKCPRCNASVKWLSRGHVDDEILNPPSGKYSNAVLPYTFFFHHHDICCRIYGCSGEHEQKK